MQAMAQPARTEAILDHAIILTPLSVRLSSELSARLP